MNTFNRAGFVDDARVLQPPLEGIGDGEIALQRLLL